MSLIALEGWGALLPRAPCSGAGKVSNYYYAAYIVQKYFLNSKFYFFGYLIIAYSCSHTACSWGTRRRRTHDTPHPPRFDIRMPSQPSPQPTRLRASETQESRNTQRARRALELPRRSFRPNRMCSAQRSTTTQPVETRSA